MSGNLAIAIPAYQAESSVGEVVEGAARHVRRVLVVDDGSSDDTQGRARSAGATVVRHPRNRGKGCALRTAFETLLADGYDFILTMDADGQHLPDQIPRLLDALDSSTDILIGSRSHLFSDMHLVRSLSNRISSRLISLVAGGPLPDAQSGFRVYSRRLIERTGFPELRFEAESAVLVRALRLGYSVRFTPVDLGFADGRVTSHYRPVLDSMRIAVAVARARLEVVGCPQVMSS